MKLPFQVFDERASRGAARRRRARRWLAVPSLLAALAMATQPAALASAQNRDRSSNGELAQPSNSARSKLFVPHIKAPKLYEALASSLELQLLASLSRRPELTVHSQSMLDDLSTAIDIAERSDPNAAELLLAAAERNLKSDSALSAKLLRLDAGWVVVMSHLDLRSGQVLGRAATEPQANSATVGAEVERLLSQLLNTKSPQPPAPAAVGRQLQLAVLPLKAEGVSAEMAAVLSALLATELSRMPEVASVMTPDDIETVLTEAEYLLLLECQEDVGCVQDFASALGRSKVVTGHVGHIEDTYLLGLRLVNMRGEVEVLRRTTEAYAGDGTELPRALRHTAHALLGHDRHTQTGGVELRFNAPSGRGKLGPRSFALGNHVLAFGSLPPGRYDLRFVADDTGFEPLLHQDVYVLPGETTVRSFELKAKAARWPRQAALIAGAVALVGGLAGGALLLKRDDDFDGAQLGTPPPSVEASAATGVR